MSCFLLRQILDKIALVTDNLLPCWLCHFVLQKAIYGMVYKCQSPKCIHYYVSNKCLGSVRLFHKPELLEGSEYNEVEAHGFVDLKDREVPDVLDTDSEDWSLSSEDD